MEAKRVKSHVSFFFLPPPHFLPLFLPPYPLSYPSPLSVKVRLCSRCHSNKSQQNVMGSDSWPPKFKEFFYIPNIIDYLRVVALVWAMRESGEGSEWHFVTWYAISYLLDMIDGEAARYFDQCSKLGYYLDMVIDRISTIVASAKAMGYLSPFSAMALLVTTVIVEIIAHGVVMYYGEVLGIHQKKMGFDYYLVNLYLGSKAGLGFGCVCYEAFLLSIILQMPLWVNLLFFPGFAFRTAACTVRLYACMYLDTTIHSE
ncbi:hypothetical protein AAMO2058_000882600 [Amorphochlora amoebiformis]